jgi:hypothetical protein
MLANFSVKKVFVLVASLVFVASSGNAHSIKSAYCNGVFPPGEPKLNILVQPDGTISGTGGGRATPFTARAKPDGTVDFFRPDGTLWYESAIMSNGSFSAIFHQPADKGGGGGRFTMPCTMR